MAKSKPRRIDFSPDEFLVGVTGMTPEEISVYWVLNSLIYSSRKAVPKDDARLFSIIKADPRTIRSAIKSLLRRGKIVEESDNNLMVNRCRDELEKAANRIQKASENGSKGGRPKDLDKPPGIEPGSGSEKLTTNYQLTTNNQQLAENAPPDGKLEERIADEIWRLAGKTAEADRKRASGSIEDFAAVREWLGKGYTEAEILAAAKASIGGATEKIRSLWKYLKSAMDDRVAELRQQSDAMTLPNFGEDDDLWRRRYRNFRAGKTDWLTGWGPEVAFVGCRLPANVKAEIDAEFSHREAA